MKLKIEFDTTQEGFDYHEMQTYLHAPKTATCLSEIYGKVRGWYKYDTRGEIPITEIYDSILDIINSHVNLDELGY